MTITLTSTKAVTLEAELRAELGNEKANEAEYLEYVTHPDRRERPLVSLHEIRESIEILELKLAEAARAADAERAKLPTAAAARKLLATVKEEEAAARSEFYAAVIHARDALRALRTAHQAHRASIGSGGRTLLNAGVPAEGAELDGDPITMTGGRIEHGDTYLRASDDPITYEWSPAIERYLNSK